MILDIYKDSLEYSAKDWKTLIILGIICFFSFLILPIFLIPGYNYRVIDTAVHGIINGKDPLPSFDDIISMFVDGVKIVIVQIAYLIPPVLIFALFIIIASNLTNTLASAVIIIGALLTFATGVIGYLMMQMGICHMANSDGAFTKAFAFQEIKEVIDSIGWFNCILTCLGLIIITIALSVIVTGLIGIIFSVLGFSGFALGVNATGVFLLGTIINILVSLFIVGPYLSIFNARSIGLLYNTQI